MKYIRKFETFDFSQTLPVASKADLTLYYHCDECNALWKQLNQESDDCKFCQSDEVEELSKEEWYETVGDRLEEDDFQDLESERAKEEDDFIDLYKLKRKDVN
jgi:hypothetical protein